jgi:hypothetical protein
MLPSEIARSFNRKSSIKETIPDRFLPARFRLAPVQNNAQLSSIYRLGSFFILF